MSARPLATRRGWAHLVLTGAHGQDTALARPDVIATWLDTLRRAGFEGVRTGAVGPGVAADLTAAGFTAVQDLVLLSCDLTTGPRAGADPRIDRIRTKWVHRQTDIQQVLGIDAASFGPDWALDRVAFDEACAATQRSRLMACRDADGTAAGFVLAGATAGSGFIQRLAVIPDRRRGGTATRLLAQAHRWLAGSGCSTSVVNTETTNEAALGLYQRFGYAPLPYGLRVLERPLADR